MSTVFVRMLIQVPNSEWHCSACAERFAQREARVDHHFDNIEAYRNREEEEDLVSELLLTAIDC